MPIHPFWIIAILVIVLIIFGPGRLPELGGAVGKAMREFRKATSELTNDVTSSVHATSVTPAPPPVAAPAPAPTTPEAKSPESQAPSSST